MLYITNLIQKIYFLINLFEVGNLLLLIDFNEVDQINENKK